MADLAGDKSNTKARESEKKPKESSAESAEKVEMERMETEAAEQSPADQADDEGSEVATCYCGAPRKLGSVELMCGGCGGWFHSPCTTANVGKSLPFMTCYQFYCKNCSQTTAESFTKKQATFSQVVYQAMANLTCTAQQEGEDRPEFSKDMDIIPFIEKNWDNMTSMTRRTKLTWHKTVQNTMMKEPELYTVIPDEGNEAYFALVNQDLTKIAPAYDGRAGPSGTQGALETATTANRSGRTKRRGAFDSLPVYSNKKNKNDPGGGPKLPPHGYPLEHPFNKDGYRYYLAEADTHAPNRQAFDDSTEMAGKPIPGYLYRVFQGAQVLLSMHDRALQLKLSDDRLTVSGEKGYAMIRASHGVLSGQWYFEVTVNELPEPSAVRVGWSQPLGNLQAPCGYDKFSYAYRSRKGSAFHQSKGHHYCDQGYGEGDTIGFYISLPKPTDRKKWLPDTFKDRPLVKFKSHLYFEEKDSVSDAEKALQPATGSQMIMYKNGECRGVAFTDVFEGMYYPAVSLYKAATVTVNFGPDFKHPPTDQQDYRPMSEAADQAMVEGTLADLLYHVEHQDKLPDFV
ncbi:set1/Ash2 histone methyltransferase complex subunit ASH2-like [Littorina saxatilis]|uniref:set1/Ash2 histone methyltransferase complex subunit ASH2-like n=1 Tax=Littorina saxatilis TaxID=31220 RepID=UPI0038B68118